jgi:excisionase family DNA binding protein
MTDDTQVPRLLVTPAEAAHALGIARSHFYVLMDRGLIGSVHIGRCRRVPVVELERFVATLSSGPRSSGLTASVDTSVQVDGRMSTPSAG